MASAVAAGKARGEAAVVNVRKRAPWLDHLIRAYGRFKDDGGNRLAASVTYFAFLSFFPLVVLAFSITGFIVDAYPAAQDSVVTAFNNFLPGLADKLNVENIGSAKVATGIIGLVGLLWAGLGWVDALREGLRAIWHHDADDVGFVSKKLNDVLVLMGLGLTLLVSVTITGAAAGVTGWVLDHIGLSGNAAAHVLLTVVGIALALAADWLVFLFLLGSLPKVGVPRRALWRGAAFGAVGIEILKVLGAILVGRATGNPVYGTFGVMVGLLIWIYLVSRLILFTAAWTVTAPFESDVPPSGSAEETKTANLETAHPADSAGHYSTV
jgi:membrane protein